MSGHRSGVLASTENVAKLARLRKQLASALAKHAKSRRSAFERYELRRDSAKEQFSSACLAADLSVRSVWRRHSQAWAVADHRWDRLGYEAAIRDAEMARLLDAGCEARAAGGRAESSRAAVKQAARVAYDSCLESLGADCDMGLALADEKLDRFIATLPAQLQHEARGTFPIPVFTIPAPGLAKPSTRRGVHP